MHSIPMFFLSETGKKSDCLFCFSMDFFKSVPTEFSNSSNAQVMAICHEISQTIQVSPPFNSYV